MINENVLASQLPQTETERFNFKLGFGAKMTAEGKKLFLKRSYCKLEKGKKI